jgi:hypothetical protein
MSQPGQQSGQTKIREIHDIVRRLRSNGNWVRIMWVPSQGVFDLSIKAKETAKQATEQDQAPQDQDQVCQAKSTIINTARAEQRAKNTLPEGVCKYSKDMDIALPGKHTRALYDSLKRREACVLAQLRTGMARLNGYLCRIGKAESDQCECGQARETVNHFLFRCTRWQEHRTQMLAQTETRRGNLSLY